MAKVTCIVPTYNEEKRITPVITVLASHPLIDQLIVVDDGSKDNTVNIVRSFPKIRLIIHEKNTGKSGAMYTGIKASSGEFLLFIDADLTGLKAENITDLLAPVLMEKADVSISLRGNTPGLWKRIGLDYISGERVFRRTTLGVHIEEIPSLRGFSLEVFLNRWIIKDRCRIKVVPWENVGSPLKYRKYGLYQGIKGDAKMMYDIFRTISIFGPIYQITRMLQLRVK